MTKIDARLGKLEAARGPVAPAWPALTAWRQGLTDEETRRRWPLAWPVIEARRAAAREAEELAGVYATTQP